MGSIIALFVIAAVALLVVRIGATALMMTGLSWDTANFQAYSAFFGVGFTTREAESVVNHPVRRRIIRDLILAGNIGLTSGLASLVVTFVQQRDTRHTLGVIGVLLLGLCVFALLSRIGLLKRAIDGFIHRSLKRAGVVHAMDYDLLLRVQSGFCISEIDVLPGSPLVGLTLAQSRPADDGIIVLGITRDNGVFVGAPGPREAIQVGDVLTVYGTEENTEALIARS